MTDPQSERARLEAEHPIARNPGRKGLVAGIVVVVAVGFFAYLAWSNTPQANIGIAYAVAGAMPYLIGGGVLLLLVRAVLLRRRRRGESDRATSEATTQRDPKA